MRNALIPARLKSCMIACLCLVAVCAGERAVGSSYIIVDDQTGKILASSGSREKRQVASLTKVATALVALDMAELKKLSLSEVVEVPGAFGEIGGASPAGLEPGDRISIRDLLYCMLLGSDNRAAMTLAYHVGQRLPNPEGLSPVGNFVSHMNALARVLKMKRTLFLNPTGFDSGTGEALPYSTAEDMARLTHYAYSQADFPFYVKQKARKVHIYKNGVDTPSTIENTNVLLGREEIDGVKTGQTRRAGGCLILSADLEPEVTRDDSTTYVTPRRLIVVLLGSSDRFGRGLALTRQGWRVYNEWVAEGRPMTGPKL